MMQNNPGKSAKIKFWIVTTEEDLASQTIKSYLLEKFPFERILPDEVEGKTNQKENNSWFQNPLYTLDLSSKNLPNYIKGVSEYFEIDLIELKDRMTMLDQNVSESDLNLNYPAHITIFASRHKSKSGLPAILTHATGIWNNDTSHGGKPHSVAKTSATLLRFAYQSLVKEADIHNLNWPVDLEVNHHGPTTLDTLSIFMELGSSEENYTHAIGSATVGDAIMNTIFDFINWLITKIDIMNFLFCYQGVKYSKNDLYSYIKKSLKESNHTYGLGFGGPHYARNFSKLYLESENVSISHIVPKYSVTEMSVDLLQSMVDNTLEPINAFIVDWKGVNSAEKKFLSEVFGNFEIPMKKTKDFK